MSKETWVIEPHDSLIVRDGRPFNNTAGSRAKSLDFPFPSTLIGSIRTRIGLKNGGNREGFDKELIDKILEIKMCGALLAELKDDEVPTLFAPAPADSLFIKLDKADMEDPKKKNLFPLVPLKDEYLSNLGKDLHLVGLNEQIKGKPNSEVKFWDWKKFEEWLIKPKSQKIDNDVEIGIGGLVTDKRTHVKIDYKKKSNIDGGLFQTRGLEFAKKEIHRNYLKFRRFGLALQINYPDAIENKLTEGITPLGGERRIVRWKKQKSFDFESEFADLKKKIKIKISESKDQCHCRLILLTPAYFEDGFLPTELNAEVKAVAVKRAQVISGWDFARRKPKPTRRLTPAGTVYFLKINGNVDEFIEETWFQNVGDCKRTRRDGFGLAVLGNWDGSYHSI